MQSNAEAVPDMWHLEIESCCARAVGAQVIDVRGAHAGTERGDSCLLHVPQSRVGITLQGRSFADDHCAREIGQVTGKYSDKINTQHIADGKRARARVWV